ncbi:unnamed protein product [Candidula unifasciata]|uniref:J domain-containing protein n=1 Tax=Candidula unifasciata TaxID=100452 RepID=A0A8S3ZEG6_9EUPU|nr:unnamed protein product [Candidula unifasciata]
MMNTHSSLFFWTAIYGFVFFHSFVDAKAKLEHYTTLGVPEKASQQEIKLAFRNLALKYHPDKNKEPDASDKFQKIAKAYSILSDPKKRQMYDLTGMEDGGFGESLNFDMSSFFKQFDEALKQGGSKSKGSKTGGSGGFFDFENLFSGMEGMDGAENNLFSAFGKSGSDKGGKKKHFLFDALAGLGDMLKLLTKPKDAPTENDKGRNQEYDQSKDTDFTDQKSP